MTAEQALAKLIETALSKIPLSLTIGTVTEVDKENGTCEVARDGQPTLHDVRLNAVIDAFDSQFTVYPSVGSFVVCLMMGDASTYMVISTTHIDEILIKAGTSEVRVTDSDILFNGGSLGGLVKISELTTALNRFVTTFNAHTHPCPGGSTDTPTTKAPRFSASEYENLKVKQ